MDNNKFADGFFYKAPNENAPEYIEGRIVINVSSFTAWLNNWIAANPNEAWLAFDLKNSRGEKKYAQINTYKKLGMTENPVKKDDDFDFPADDSQIPF